MTDKWTLEDSEQAINEGWDVFDIDNNHTYDIQCHDDDPQETFETDQDALDHVRVQASTAQSSMHAKALRIVKDKDNDR